MNINTIRNGGGHTINAGADQWTPKFDGIVDVIAQTERGHKTINPAQKPAQFAGNRDGAND